MDHVHPGIARAIEAIGSQPKLGKLVGISQQQISKMLNRQRKVSAEIALAIEQATKGKVGRAELRPDLHWSEPRG